MSVLITGSAGFIGYHLIEKWARQGNTGVIGLDNINDYYDVNLKYARLMQSGIHPGEIRPNRPVQSTKYPHYTFYQTDISDYSALSALFRLYTFDVVIHLAAQAGVRYSIEKPHPYIQSNIVGFANVLECCRQFGVKHLVYASSSSVYGINDEAPFSEEADTNHPVSIYAATKKSNELLAHAYSHLFRLPTTGVRLFTVYGPWGRPDMAPMLFAEAIHAGKPIRVYNNGEMSRDFTYVEDIADGILKLTAHAPGADTERPFYRIFNIGNSRPVQLMDFISLLEKTLDRKAQLEWHPMQPGDVPATYADTSKLVQFVGCKPITSIEAGISTFVEWFKTWKCNN